MLGSAYAAIIDPLLKDVRRFVLPFSGMNAGDKVLDVCCGTGKQVLLYGSAGMEAVGIDLDPRMLRVAASDRLKSSVPSVSFLLADATAMPFTTGRFDSASVSFALHDKSAEARRSTVREMIRVVKPGGKLVFIDFHVPLTGNIWGHIARLVERLVGGDHYRGFRHYCDNGGLVRILREQGLREMGRVVWPNGLFECVVACYE